MSGRKHTPGPWRVIVRRNQTGTTHCFVVGGPSNTQIRPDGDDATLIAAAPELLDALESVVDAVAKFVNGHEDWAEIEAARRAIAKAKGE